jgi:hypothetical protein
MTTSRRLTWAALGAAGLTGLAAGTHSVVTVAEYFGTSVADTLTLTVWAALPAFTGWVVALALVMTVTSGVASQGARVRWWWPSALVTAVLVGGTAAAWADGHRVSSARSQGHDADHLLTWPGESTPGWWWDGDAAQGWDVDLLTASGPVVVLLAVWAGPLLLRLCDGRSVRAAPGVDLPARPSAETWLRAEISRATSVATAVGVVLCAALVYLQLAGGIFAASSPYGEPLAAVLLGPGGLVVLLALATAWAAGRPSTGGTPASPPAAGTMLPLVGAVAAVAALDGSSPDLVLLVGGTLGIVCAACHGVLGDRAAHLLLSSGRTPGPVIRTPSAPEAPSVLGLPDRPEHVSPQTTRPPAADAVP